MNNSVNTKEELSRVLLLHGPEIINHGVIRLGFFGSFVHNKVTDKSDVDFFIDIDPAFKTLKNFLSLSALLSHLTGRKVEIVTPQSLNKFTGKYILDEVEYVALAA